MPFHSPPSAVPAFGRSARRAGLSLLVLLLALAPAWAATTAHAATGHALREASRIAYGSPADGGAISTAYDAGNRRANEIARTASDPDRERLFLITRPYTDGTVRVFRVDLLDGTEAQRLPQATIPARNAFNATLNAAVDPKDGHLWVIVRDAANLPRLIRVDPDSGTIRANLALPSTANNVASGPMRIDPVGDRLWLSGGRYVANVPLDAARAAGATNATLRITDLRGRPLYSDGTFSGIQAATAGVAFAHDDREHGGRTGPWTYVPTQGPAGLLWISDQTASDLSNSALPVAATPAISPDNGRSEGTANAIAVDPDSGDILQAIDTPNDGNFGRIVRLARDTRTPSTTAAPGVATAKSGLFRFAGDEVWWRGQGETMVLDRTTLEPRVTVTNPPGTVPSESELLLDDRLYVPVADGVSVRELEEVEIPDANASPISGRSITDGTIEWGVRHSWRQYIISGVASGRVDLTAPAFAGGIDPTAAGFAYRFPGGQGVYDPDNGELRLTTKGGVRFTGHYSGGTPALDVSFADPTVIVRRDGTALLTAAGRDSEGNALGNWPFVDLDVTGVTVTRDGDARTVTYSAVPTTLRSDGQPIFQGNYPAGSSFDPITFSFTYHESETATWDPTTTPQTRNGVPVDPDDPGGDPDPDPDDDGTPTEPTTPGGQTVTTSTSKTTVVASAGKSLTGTATTAPRIAVRGAQRLRRGVRWVELAQVTCRRGPCRLSLLSGVRVTVGGVGYRARATGARGTTTGRTVALRVTLPAGAISRMQRTGRAAVVRAQVRVTSPGGRTTRVARRVLWGAR